VLAVVPIGGTVAAARNVIAGVDAITLNTASSTAIEGNYIGTDRTGTTPIGSLKAINMTGCNGTQIGGSMAGEGNVLGGNGDGVNTQGIVMDLATSTKIQGNFIGTDTTGTHNTGPFEIGVTVVRATGTKIGGTDPGEGNVIANDSSAGTGGTGVSIFFSGAPPVADVLIEGNSLYGNDGLAILSYGIAAPVLTGATSTTITGHIVGSAGSSYRSSISPRRTRAAIRTSRARR
jgi:hypothetical protein